MAEAHVMTLDKDVAVPMRDGAVLRANVFKPEAPGRYPTIITLGPYGKDVHMSTFLPDAWKALTERQPEILKASSCKYMGFETPDPEVWVPHGYVMVKVDSRGAGKSPGILNVNSPEEFRDFYDAIEWAAAQPWSNGKVGILGISYYACGQWVVAALRPPHLAAILPWQGTFDFYRDRTGHGGMLCNGFTANWFNRSCVQDQYGNSDSPFKDFVTGERNTGPASLSAEELRANRVDYVAGLKAHRLLDDYYKSRTGDLSKIEIPALVVANWGGLGLHLRGTILGYAGIASREKWLKVQTNNYFSTFFIPQSVALQRRFFDRYLKGLDNGWEREPRVEVIVRSVEDKVKRTIVDTRWPLSDTEWTKLHLDAGAKSLAAAPPAQGAKVSYPGLGQGVTFSTVLERDLDFAGPIKARLHVSSSTEDMDIFATLRAFDPSGKEITFFAATEERCAVSQGWLRVSHRKTDPQRSTDYLPLHTHDELQKLTPGEIYAVDVEIWPASLSLPKGYRLELMIEGKDFERPNSPGPRKGNGIFYHNDPEDRPPAIYGGSNTLHTGPGHESYLLLPVLTK